MIVKSIKLKNFEIYDKFQVSFTDITFIKGKNGSGKTTLAVDALLFVLFGYTKKTLAEIPTRGKSKSCTVELSIDHNGHSYEITRKYPTSIKVMEDGVELKFATGQEAQRYLQKIFGNVNNFKQFRMIDSEVGINFLEQGQQALKKVLFSVSDKIFNDVKDKLNKIKHHREIYNKEKAVIYIHHPSEKRLNILEEGVRNKSDTHRKLKQEDQKLYQEQYSLSNQKGQTEGKLKTAKWQKGQTDKNTHCYACKQELSSDTKKSMQDIKTKEIEDLIKELKDLDEMSKEINEIRVQAQIPLDKLNLRVNKLNKLLIKLEGRLKQKEYIYTQKDIEVAKKALKELDNLSTRYLTQSVKILEPIINAVLDKIGFRIEFEVNDKGKFNITLYKGAEKFSYVELSKGQKLILQIAFKVALMLERGEDGLMVADEGLSSLDDDNMLHILTIFENYPLQLIFVRHGFNQTPAEIKVIDLNIVREK